MCGGRERDVRTVFPVYAGARGTNVAGGTAARQRRSVETHTRRHASRCDPDYDVQRADTHVHGSVDVKIKM